MPIMGDSVAFDIEFKTFDNQYADPTNITFKVYDSNKKQIGETKIINESNKTDVGKYRVIYTIPDINTVQLSKIDCKLFAEIKGTLEGVPILQRIEFDRKFKK